MIAVKGLLSWPLALVTHELAAGVGPVRHEAGVVVVTSVVAGTGQDDNFDEVSVTVLSGVGE